MRFCAKKNKIQNTKLKKVSEWKNKILKHTKTHPKSETETQKNTKLIPHRFSQLYRYTHCFLLKMRKYNTENMRFGN